MQCVPNRGTCGSPFAVGCKGKPHFSDDFTASVPSGCLLRMRDTLPASSPEVGHPDACNMNAVSVFRVPRVFFFSGRE